MSEENIKPYAQIILKPNGSCVVKGPVEIVHENGEVEFRELNASICRCGLSKEKPFCDGSHKALMGV